MMTPTPEQLALVSILKKPKTENEIKEHLKRRLQTANKVDNDTPLESSPIAVGHDSQGNRIIQSGNRLEYTLSGQKPSTLIASKEANPLIRYNPQLLRQIASGEIVNRAKEVFSGTEASVFIVPLTIDSTNHTKSFAIKYAFPTDTSYEQNQSECMFTSPIDQMRLMQWLSKQKGLHFKYNIPLLATHDIQIAPYIDNAMNAHNLLIALTPQKGGTHQEIPTDFYLEFFFLETNYPGFFQAFKTTLISELLKLDSFLNSAIRKGTIPKDIETAHLSSDIIYKWKDQWIPTANTLIQYKDFRKVIEFFEQNPQDALNNSEKWQQIVAQTCTLIEVASYGTASES